MLLWKKRWLNKKVASIYPFMILSGGIELYLLNNRFITLIELLDNLLENRAEIQGLESVTCGTKPALIWLVLLGVPAIVIGVAAMKFPDPVGMIAEFCMMLLVVIWLPITIWGLITYRHQGQFTTDNEGLYIRGLFSSRFICWRSIRSVQTLSDRKYEFVTDQGRYVISPPNIYVLASISQHLRRYGFENGFEVPASIEVIWNPAPGNISSGIIWENPNKANTWLWNIWQWFILSLCAVSIFLWYKYHYLHDLLSVLAFLYAVLTQSFNFLMFRFSPLVAHSITVTDDRLIVEYPRNRKEIPWDEIQYVQTSKRYMHIDWRGGSAYIPLVNKDEALYQALTAISYRLGNRQKPMLFAVPDLSINAI